jgi:hypothetical protein
MTRWIFAAGLALIGATAGRADTPFDPAAAAKMLAPYLDEQTVAVARLDLNAVDIDELSQKMVKLTGLAANQIDEGRKHVREVQAQLRKAGAREIYAVMSLADMPMPGPFVLVPVAAGGDAKKIAEVFEGLNMEETWDKNGVLAAGPKKSIERLKTMTPAARPDLAAALGAIPSAAAQVVLVPGADQRRVLEESLPKLPAELGGGPGSIVSKGVKWASAGMVTKPKVSLHVVVQSPDESAAKSLAEVANKALGFVAQAGKEMQLDLRPIVPALAPKVSGNRLTMSLSEDDKALSTVLSDAAQKTRAAAGRANSMNNLKQIALALHNYHDAMGSFPPTGSMSKDGKALLSWRVHILPFVEQDNLYKQFKLDEPWDSEHNKALIAKMPDIYRSPAQKVRDGKTTYLAPMGNNTAIAPGPKGMKLVDITDGTSNTILTVEVNDDAAVIWTKPDDLDIAAGDVLKKILGHYDGGFITGIADGSVRFIRATIDPKILQSLFTRNGGEVTDWNKIP